MKSHATFTWQDLLTVSQGKSVSHHRPFTAASLETDTRALETGSFFLPLKGANFDGNTYIEQAFDQGAEGAFVDESYLHAHPHLKRFPNIIAVDDPLITYLQLARFHRRRCDVKVVAITGSSGKTTTKEMLYTLLSAVLGKQVQKSDKNFNNEVGVAMTLLNLRPETDILVQEMGMRGLGQIALLSQYAEPDIAIISNIGPAHIGLLGSLANIAKAKCEIFSGMGSENGIGIINGDDPLLIQEVGRSWNGHLETFSLHEIDEIHTKPDGNLTFDYEGLTFSLALPGSHNVMNVLSCLKAYSALGFPLKKVIDVLGQFETGGARWEKTGIEGFENLWIINDAYNANPDSVRVALGAFMDSHTTGLQKVAILGGMAELGTFSEHYHREIGEWISNHGGLDGLIVIGEEAKPLADAVLPNVLPTFAIQSNVEAVPIMLEHWPQNTIFFLKASRAFHLEDIPALLKEQALKNPHVVS